jgi:glycosyltransferase involved in cell wall biosynthesis
MNAMIFDQYSRYKACSDLLRQTDFIAGNSVLDIGSGPECLFGKFLPDATLNYVDPLIPSGSGQGHITGNVFAGELDGQTFDCVSAVDVLEHVPPEYRHAFLERMASLGKNTIILGFPTSDSTDALETDKAIDDQYREIFGHDYSWLEEHYRYGLPSRAETVDQLGQLGWHCQAVGHGHAPWLRELLGFVIRVNDIPTMKDVVLAISEKFNRELYQYDFRAPYYRQFVIASRSPLPPISAPVPGNNIEAAEKAFRALMEDAKQQYFITSLRQLAERDGLIVSLNQKIEAASIWGKTQYATALESNAYIAILNQKTEEVSSWAKSLEQALSDKQAELMKMSDWAKSLEQALSDKQAELMKMSDWAQGMKMELARRNVSIVSFMEKTAKRGGALARNKLAQSFVGDMVRHVRDSRRSREKQVSLEIIRESVLDNHGRLIITFPIITWDFRWQRPQHIVSRLRDRGFSVLYVAMSLAPLGRRLRSNQDAIAQLSFNELAPHVNQIWLHSSRQLNIYTDPVADDDLFNIYTELDALISELRPKSIIYLVQFPGWGPVAQDLQTKMGGKVVFDCMDDHGGFSTNTAKALKTEEVLMKNADLVITSSNLLEERARLVNPNTIQVKNGTEFEHFTDPVRNGQLDHLSDRPIIGYYGAVSDWFDMIIIAHCATLRPDWNFVLIGATFGADLQPVAGLENVYLLGEKPYKDLPGYLAYFDVCTIPFKLIPLTMATNPVKFYEYLSAGKPVVSIDLPELHAYREDCYLAHDADAFSALLEQAYNERDDEIKIERRLKLASENSWDARVNSILESEIFKTYLKAETL